MTTRAGLILSVLAIVLAACNKSPAAPIPTRTQPPLAPVPTSALVVPVPSATMAPQAQLISPVKPAIIAKKEGSPTAILMLVKLRPGRKYRLAVTSSAGAVAFSGTWSQSAVGTDGSPGIKTGLLEGKTPANFDIVPPVASVAKDWTYSASVSSKTLSSITITIMDVTP